MIAETIMTIIAGLITLVLSLLIGMPLVSFMVDRQLKHEEKELEELEKKMQDPPIDWTKYQWETDEHVEAMREALMYSLMKNSKQ